ncbi:MAG TPA: hypothetical protein VG735_08035 [Caulobacterales bacterium]|nr:hypothetical protein [Caulobacterales bacterium]
MSLKTNISAAISIIETTAPDGGSATVRQSVEKVAELLNGTGNTQADLAFIDTRTLASNTTEDLDLAGVLANALGATLTMAEVCAVLIVSDPANTTNLTIGNATAECLLWFGTATDTEILKPGGFSMHYAPAGWAVTATSADDLKIANAAGASASYSIAIIGRSA